MDHLERSGRARALGGVLGRDKIRCDNGHALEAMIIEPDATVSPG